MGEWSDRRQVGSPGRSRANALPCWRGHEPSCFSSHIRSSLRASPSTATFGPPRSRLSRACTRRSRRCGSSPSAPISRQQLRFSGSSGCTTASTGPWAKLPGHTLAVRGTRHTTPRCCYGCTPRCSTRMSGSWSLCLGPSRRTSAIGIAARRLRWRRCSAPRTVRCRDRERPRRRWRRCARARTRGPAAGHRAPRMAAAVRRRTRDHRLSARCHQERVRLPMGRKTRAAHAPGARDAAGASLTHTHQARALARGPTALLLGSSARGAIESLQAPP
jgi:hypothetical protein